MDILECKTGGVRPKENWNEVSKLDLAPLKLINDDLCMPRVMIADAW